MAKKVKEEVVDQIEENIQLEPLENVMSDRYASYAKYVIQDRAIPDVRDGLKPVQRRIIYTMYKTGNIFSKPTRKCAHTVGAVMGTFHPHGDSSIYEALARLSQDWKLRYPLIDFQGNNGSVDGDSPAHYRYTESRLSELSNELIKDIEKNTVDMQLNFDDTEYEPVVLPSYFPNLLVNGTEGIAVALATEIPPHNLKEVIDAIIYRINHKTATIEDLLGFVKGPDFPGGGIIYESEGLKNIYLTGRGKIEMSAKAEIVEQKDVKQIVITEIPYKIVKKDLVYEIDKIIHSKSVSGIIEVRDESDLKGIRIVVDCKKDSRVDLLLQYLKNKTPMVSSYSANMVAILNGKPKTLNLLEFIDSYIDHQIDVTTRKTKFDLEKASARLHIVNGLIIATNNISEVVEIIRKSKDKADSKINLMKRFELSNEQAESIVTMPLYKLSHTDETILLNEQKELEKVISEYKAILDDPNKLNRVIIKNLKVIYNKYGDERRTLIEEKGEIKPIDKRELIAKEEVMLAITRDGYVKRSSIKSYRGSGENSLPGLKESDRLICDGKALTTDYLVCFTNKGNFIYIPVHKINESKWKDEGMHINNFTSMQAGEKIIKAIVATTFKEDVYFAVLTKLGQIKRANFGQLANVKPLRMSRFMNLMHDDEVVDVALLSGNSNVAVFTANGSALCFNENDINIYGIKAGGMKCISGLNKDQLVGLVSFLPDEKSKIVLVTNKGHSRILDTNKITLTNRLSKAQTIVPSFKSDVHKIVGVTKCEKGLEQASLHLWLSNNDEYLFTIVDLHSSDIAKYAKKNIDIPARTSVVDITDYSLETVNNSFTTYPIIAKEPKQNSGNSEVSDNKEFENSIKDTDEKPIAMENQKKKDDESYEQISIFDDLE